MPKKHYDWKINEPLPKIGAHSIAKHSVFASYVERYIRILSPHPAKRELNLTIVDGFCGGGRYTFNGCEIDGSPLVLLRAVQTAEAEMAHSRQNGFKVKAEFHFVDKTSDHIDFLRSELSKSGFAPTLGRTIHLSATPFENQAPQIIRAIQSKGPSNRALFFLDQYGWSEVSFAVIRAIFQELKNPEVLLTFSVDSLINYLTAETAKKRSGQAIEIPGEVAGSLSSLRTETGARYVIQNTLYKHVQANTGARFYTPFFIRSPDSRRSYWLLHLSKHVRARDEMARLHWSMTNTFVHYGEAGFNALGFDPDVDPNQGLFEFDFGSNARKDSLEAAMMQLPKLIYEDAQHTASAPTIGGLFAARCNETPLTLELVSEAIVRLRDEYGEVEVFTREGKPRQGAVRLDSKDHVRLARQRTMMRVFRNTSL